MKRYIPLLETQNKIVKLMHKFPEAREVLEELIIATEDMPNISTEVTGKNKTRELNGQSQLIEVAERFNAWLEQVSAECQISKDQLQDIIKYFLM